MTDFEKMVKAMRKAQKEYFANRTPAMLQEANAWNMRWTRRWPPPRRAMTT
ncbi:MAG: hypothetical protein J5746_13555 [Victivallales bacterium]|nr:hypothetical protein [Victivallales bacterium]